MVARDKGMEEEREREGERGGLKCFKEKNFNPF